MKCELRNKYDEQRSWEGPSTLLKCYSCFKHTMFGEIVTRTVLESLTRSKIFC